MQVHPVTSDDKLYKNTTLCSIATETISGSYFTQLQQFKCDTNEQIHKNNSLITTETTNSGFYSFTNAEFTHHLFQDLNYTAAKKDNNQ